MSAAISAEDERMTGDAVASPWWSHWIRRKGNIGPQGLTLLTIAMCVPLVLAFSRVIAMPGADIPMIVGLEPLRELGKMLDRSLSLQWVPPSDRGQILYLLLLPTGALIVALARLTFGLQVLGLRSILIAIGFQEIGFLPSFALMLVVVGVTVLIRPSMRNARLPLYARITVILCMCATIMVVALLIGPWLQSESIWNVAFFPVIIMAMLAEGIAKTFAQNEPVKAVWRLAWTIIVALVIAVVGQNVAIGNLALHFPELMLTQLLAIVFVAEFFDLRLLERWPERLSRLFEGLRPWYHERPRIAFVRNRWGTGVIGRLGTPAPGRYRKRSVQRAVDALRDQGFYVRVFEADMGLLRELRLFLPPDPRTNAPGGLVFNVATGVQGDGRFCHVPAMLEMAGVAYTGPDPMGHARLTDRYVLMSLLRQAGVPVPRFALMSNPREETKLAYPIAVSPRCAPDVGSIVVRNRAALEEAVRDLFDTYRQDVFIEEWTPGPEYRVALIGNDRIEYLPVLEYSPEERRETCPAPLSEAEELWIRECACEAYRAAGCRDYARVDLRIAEYGRPIVVDINWADLLVRRGSFISCAEAAGYSFEDLVRGIVDVASLRYASAPVSRTADQFRKSTIPTLSGPEVAAH